MRILRESDNFYVAGKHRVHWNDVEMTSIDVRINVVLADSVGTPVSFYHLKKCFNDRNLV